jgi:release factor glutamine methyltransferase
MQAWSFFKRSVMSFWYLYVGILNRLWPSITLEGKRLTIFPGVYKPLENEPACAEYCEDGDRVLDLGCGSGVCGIFCAPKAREVVAVDISAAAVRNTEENCRRLGLSNVTALQSDMFSRVEGRFDLILANAPYIAADFQNEDAQFATSVRYLPTLFAEASERLTSEGRLLVQFPIWFRRRIEGLAARHGLRVVAVRRLPPKSLGLSLLSLAYLQVGFRSAFFLIRPLRVETVAPAEQGAKDLIQAGRF